MNLAGNTAEGFLKLMKAFFPGGVTQVNNQPEEPLRAELFNSDQMAQHSIALATLHVISKKKAKRPIVTTPG